MAKFLRKMRKQWEYRALAVKGESSILWEMNSQGAKSFPFAVQEGWGVMCYDTYTNKDRGI